VAEIAKAFLTNEETIAKRLYRARNSSASKISASNFHNPVICPSGAKVY